VKSQPAFIAPDQKPADDPAVCAPRVRVADARLKNSSVANPALPVFCRTAIATALIGKIRKRQRTGPGFDDFSCHSYAASLLSV